MPHVSNAIGVVVCAVLEIEVGHFVARSSSVVGVERLPQGLHNEPDRLRVELQNAVDRIEKTTDCDTVVLGYGLCSRGSEGVKTRRARLVVPRAHDCIALLLGSHKRYKAYVEEHPGTYWYSPGWNRFHLPPGKERYERLRHQYLAQYGEENADYLMEQEQAWFSTYSRATFVDIGIGAKTDDIEYTKECARWLGWEFDRQRGSPKFIHDLVFGPWDDERFLVLQPGETHRMTADDRVIERAPAAP
ncbi:MAG: DUF1638 domain-containing protein [Fimbriimonadaceae bacterium]